MNDLFTYPEGWDQMLNELDFLPEDNAVRNELLYAFMTIAFMIW